MRQSYGVSFGPQSRQSSHRAMDIQWPNEPRSVSRDARQTREKRQSRRQSYRRANAVEDDSSLSRVRS